MTDPIEEDAEKIKGEQRSPWINVDRTSMGLLLLAFLIVMYQYATKKFTDTQTFYAVLFIIVVWYLLGRRNLIGDNFITAEMALRMMRHHTIWQKNRYDSGISANDQFITNPQVGLQEVDGKPHHYIMNVLRFTPDEDVYMYEGNVDCYKGNPFMKLKGIVTTGSEALMIKHMLTPEMLAIKKNPTIARFLK